MRKLEWIKVCCVFTAFHQYFLAAVCCLFVVLLHSPTAFAVSTLGFSLLGFYCFRSNNTINKKKKASWEKQNVWNFPSFFYFGFNVFQDHKIRKVEYFSPFTCVYLRLMSWRKKRTGNTWRSNRTSIGEAREKKDSSPRVPGTLLCCIIHQKHPHGEKRFKITQFWRTLKAILLLLRLRWDSFWWSLREPISKAFMETFSRKQFFLWNYERFFFACREILICHRTSSTKTSQGWEGGHRKSWL